MSVGSGMIFRMQFSYRAQHLLQLMIQVVAQASAPPSFTPEVYAKLFEPLVEKLSAQQWADLCVAVGTVVPLPADVRWGGRTRWRAWCSASCRTTRG